jgi:EmrB/QacA subfamily drug resistance transporter
MAQPLVEPCSRGTIEAEPCPRELGREIASGRRRMVRAACVLASAMAFIDGSALTVALPTLRADFGADLASVQWVLNGYVLAVASLTLIGGALGDIYGKARILAVGCVLFAIASIACALAPSAAWLIVARIVQGIAGALIAPTSLALIGAIYPREERNRAIGVWAAASSLTTVAGPVLGGWLTEAFGWPSVFWINPPIALVAVALLWAFAPADRHASRQLDLVGAAILTVALAVLAAVLSQLGERQSPASFGGLIALAALGCVGLAVYVAWERASEHAMTPPRLAHNRPFVGLNVATLLIYGGMSIMFFLVPFELIDRRALSSTAAGAALLPLTLAIGFLSRWFGGVADRVGARIMLIVGPTGAALSYVWMALGQQASLLLGVLVPMTLLGLSFAVLVTPLTASVLSSVDPADEGLASGINNAASRIAQLAGVAGAAALGSLAAGYQFGLAAAALVTLAGGITMALTVPAPLNSPISSSN